MELLLSGVLSLPPGSFGYHPRVFSEEALHQYLVSCRRRTVVLLSIRETGRTIHCSLEKGGTIPGLAIFQTPSLPASTVEIILTLRRLQSICRSGGPCPIYCSAREIYSPWYEASSQNSPFEMIEERSKISLHIFRLMDKQLLLPTPTWLFSNGSTASTPASPEL
jgi:hypothetical protein